MASSYFSCVEMIWFIKEQHQTDHPAVQAK